MAPIGESDSDTAGAADRDNDATERGTNVVADDDDDDAQPHLGRSSTADDDDDDEQRKPGLSTAADASREKDDDDPSSRRGCDDIEFVDHFSLYVPSSTVKFRGARVHVYESTTDQFLLEDRRLGPSSALGNEDNDGTGEAERGGSSRRSGSGGGGARHTITVKRMSNANFGLRLLRLVYTLVTLLVSGYYFVFCFQLLLFLFLQLPADAGRASGQERNVSRFIGTLLAIPILLYGMASLMAICTAFVVDTWEGGRLLRAAMGWSAVVTESLYFAFFLGIPALAFIVNLLAKSPNAWEQSALVWLWTVSLVLAVFGIAVVYRELSSCYRLVALLHDDGGEEEEESGNGNGVEETTKWGRFFRLAKRAVLHSQTYRYSGLREERYFVSGEDERPSEGYSQSEEYEPAQIRTSLYSRTTQLGCCDGAYIQFERPRRLYTTAEVRDILPFITAHSWSLESMCCRDRNSRMIAAARGPSALRSSQMKSSVACNILGSILVLFTVVGVLVWMEVGAVVYIVVAIMCLLCCVLPMARSSYAMYEMHREINEAAGGESKEAKKREAFDDEEDPSAGSDAVESLMTTATKKKTNEQRTTMFQVWETVKVTEPKAWYCWTRLVLEVVFLFLWPLVTTFASGNSRVGGVFLVVGLFSFLRIYFDASAVLSEIGSMSDVDVGRKDHGDGDGDNERQQQWWARSMLQNNSEIEDERALIAKARLSEIVGKISKSDAVHRWIWLFSVFVILVFVVFLSAIGSDDVAPSERPPIKLASGFYYPPQPGLAYPTCELTKGFSLPGVGVGSTALGDYAFLAALAYEMPNVTEARLAEWFGPDEVVDEAEFVAKWRVESETADNPVYFKLFSFVNYPGVGLVSIRGSQTSWDWLVNMQLWSSAALAQVVKWLIPYGWVWNPLLHHLVTAVNWIESDSLKKVSYYKVTTAFVNDVLAGYDDSNYDALRVTGASLGGGLAIITGAQTAANAIAISGLGAELSRDTFDPPVTLDALNNQVFNFIPDRDVIARIGGRSRLYQEAQCTADVNDLFGCHSMWRSVCEIEYRCGTWGRPVICRCVESFGYPEPVQNGTVSFADACAAMG